MKIKKYLQQRLKSYFFMIFGILLGFLISELVFDNPDYTAAIIAILLGLIIGELFVLTRWKKEID